MCGLAIVITNKNNVLGTYYDEDDYQVVETSQCNNRIFLATSNGKYIEIYGNKVELSHILIFIFSNHNVNNVFSRVTYQ